MIPQIVKSILKQFFCTTRKTVTVNTQTLQIFTLQRAMFQCACVMGKAVTQI